MLYYLIYCAFIVFFVYIVCDLILLFVCLRLVCLSVLCVVVYCCLFFVGIFAVDRFWCSCLFVCV